MRCNLFKLDRKALLPEAEKNITNFHIVSETEQFIFIMSSENRTAINGNYINIITQLLRKKSIFMTTEPALVNVLSKIMQIHFYGSLQSVFVKCTSHSTFC